MMLNAVLKTIAELLAGGTSLVSTEQIDFSPPTYIDKGAGPILNVYFYDLRESKQVQHSGRQVERHVSTSGLRNSLVSWTPDWFDLSFLITAWDRTALGECQLLSEATSVLLRHQSLHEDFLTFELQKYGKLSLSISSDPPIDIGALWGALNLPLKPAIYLKASIPFEPQSTIKPVVWERILDLNSSAQNTGDQQRLNRQVSVAGLVKNRTNALPISDASIVVQDLDRYVSSNNEGIFYVENLNPGNYVLELKHEGYLSLKCNVLVDGDRPTFKEIDLAPC